MHVLVPLFICKIRTHKMKVQYRRIVQVAEINLSAWIHLLYCVYIMTAAVATELFGFVRLKLNLRSKVENKITTSNLPPIVLVHGVFGFGHGRMGGLQYFGGAENKYERVLVPDLGSLTSIHDRARELFYYLKGGLVDYGEHHSRACGHSQFGKFYQQGQYPEWDDDHPIQFVGHSSGAQVVRLLHQMLADKAFKGYKNTSPNWILSITSLSGALNGSTRTCIEGMEIGDRRSMKAISLIQMCRVAVIVYEWCDIPWLKRYYSFGFDHFNMSRKKMGLRALMGCLLGKSGPFASGDWILPDLTLQGTTQLNHTLTTFPNTYYFSYATKHTINMSNILGTHPLLFLRALQMSRWRLPPDAPLPYQGYRDEDWWDNDGAMNTISMLYPRLPIQHPHCLVGNDSDTHQKQPGIWYYMIIDGDHLLYILNNRERARVQFDFVYNSIFNRCMKIMCTFKRPLGLGK